ncbi:hypothetical protein A0H81_10061 [Grifola frondosa]|uniref:Uncharacterized protein n=1 Tax=Grifola frondosa TaxID=5627 RepID=A0A1C7LZ24_GRIFR|nr:hypothetical protein A0H81_10061 [Grifola frondosa]
MTLATFLGNSEEAFSLAPLEANDRIERILPAPSHRREMSPLVCCRATFRAPVLKAEQIFSCICMRFVASEMSPFLDAVPHVARHKASLQALSYGLFSCPDLALLQALWQAILPSGYAHTSIRES